MSEACLSGQVRPLLQGITSLGLDENKESVFTDRLLHTLSVQYLRVIGWVNIRQLLFLDLNPCAEISALEYRHFLD